MPRTSTDQPAPTLVRLGGTPSLPAYVRSLWERRGFAWQTALGELRSQHLDTALGNLWHLLNPILMISVYFLVFGLILQVTRGVDNFLAFLAIGVFTFHFSQKSIVGAGSTIVNNQGLIRSLLFPRALLPIATVVREAMAYVSAAVVMIALVVITGEPITPAWLLVLLAFALQVVFNLGGALIAARLVDRYRDMLNVLPFVFRLAFYLSGVLYAFEAYVDDPRLLRLLPLNPFYTFLTLPREYLLTGQNHPHIGEVWLAAVLWAGLLALGGLVFFRAGEKEYGRG